MTSSRKNKTLFIDVEAVSALTLVKDGLLYPVTKLMNKQESQKVLQTGLINSKSFPFPFILAPSGQKNQQVMQTLQKGEEITLVHNKKDFATLVVDDIFEINSISRVKQIYGTDDFSHPGVLDTLKRLGSFAVSGEYTLVEAVQNRNVTLIEDAKKSINAKHISAIFMNTTPLHRAHERLIRQTLDKTDLLVIFLAKPYKDEKLSYDIRKEALDFFVNNFLPKNRVVILPLEYSYIFSGFNEIMINAIVAKNHGCNRMVIGRNHGGLGMFYDKNLKKSIIDKIVGIDIDIVIFSEYVYCDKCTTLVSKTSCPHGQHHHISYNSESILELLQLGILPPAVLMRKEISSFILSKILPQRFPHLERLYSNTFPVEGLLKEHTEQDFYLELMKLYQTTSLT